MTAQQPESLGLAGNWGIDTVRLAVPVRVEQCDMGAPVWTRRRDEDVGVGRIPVTRVSGTVTVEGAVAVVSISAAAALLTIEFNAARLAALPPPGLLHPDALPVLVRRFLEHMGPVISPSFATVSEYTGEILWSPDWADTVIIRRLDIARDFETGSADVAAMLGSGLASAQPSHFRRTDAVKSSDGGWTLYVKTKRSGLDRLYDKHVESGGLASPGVVRFETQVEGTRRRSLSLKTLSDVSATSCEAAIQKRWQATRWGQDVAIRCGVAEILLTRFPREDAQHLMAFLAFSDLGGEIPYTDRRQREMRRQLRSVGIRCNRPYYQQALTTMRLNFTTGAVDTDLDAAACQAWLLPDHSASNERLETGIPTKLVGNRDDTASAARPAAASAV